MLTTEPRRETETERPRANESSVDVNQRSISADCATLTFSPPSPKMKRPEKRRERGREGQQRVREESRRDAMKRRTEQH